jgi:hypothetical protein
LSRGWFSGVSPTMQASPGRNETRARAAAAMRRAGETRPG